MRLKEYIDLEKGNRSRLAKALAVHAPDASGWASESRPVPIKYGYQIELHTGGLVTRKELFPETYQKIWPDLVDQEEQKAVNQ